MTMEVPDVCVSAKTEQPPTALQVREALSFLRANRDCLIEGGYGDVYRARRIIGLKRVSEALCTLYGSLYPESIYVPGLQDFHRCDLLNEFSSKHPKLSPFFIESCDNSFQLDERVSEAVAFVRSIEDLIPRQDGPALYGSDGMEAQASVGYLPEQYREKAEKCLSLLIKVWREGLLSEKYSGSFLREIILKALDADPGFHLRYRRQMDADY